MNDTEPKGCLAAILGLFGINFGGPAKGASGLPYCQRDDFLSAAEFSFYRVLSSAVGDRAVICPKVNLADIFFVARPNENQGYRNKIDRKHVDFLLCDSATMKPRCGIELDDSSHARRDRQNRDELVDQVFEAAGLPLVRLPVQAAYTPARLLEMVEPHLGNVRAMTSPPPLEPKSESPICPKCGVPMLERVASKGKSAGQKFWGCPNFPRCKKVV